MDTRETQFKQEKLIKQGKLSIIGFILFMALLILAYILKYLFKIEEQKLWPLAVILAVIMLQGIILQLSLKCPYCNFRLGLVTRLGIPSLCPKCKKKLK